MARAVTRTMLILECLGMIKEGLTHAQISKALKIPKSSVSSILGDLMSLDFISFDLPTKKYSLGPKIIFLAHNYLEGLDLIKIGAPIVRALAAATGESVGIYIASGKESQLIFKQDSPQPVSHMLKVGARAPCYAIAAGKVLLAYHDERKIADYLRTIRLAPLTRKTITDPELLRLELAGIRAGALGYNHEEFDEEVTGIAAPVNDRFGKVVASLTVVGPTFRMNGERRRLIERVLWEKSNEFSHQLGFDKPVTIETVNKNL